ncbi:MAG: hypothetical protein ACSLFD_12470, partial [Solirubrobacterales bacterium]
MSESSGNSDTTVLVAGDSGYPGGRDLNQLPEQGYRVRTTVRDESKAPAIRAAVTAGIRRFPAGLIALLIGLFLVGGFASGASANEK